MLRNWIKGGWTETVLGRAWGSATLVLESNDGLTGNQCGVLALHEIRKIGFGAGDASTTYRRPIDGLGAVRCGTEPGGKGARRVVISGLVDNRVAEGLYPRGLVPTGP